MAKGYINKEQLSEELQNEIENSGMTEEQVIEIVGDKSQLATENKTDLVAAINELFQSANNGKQIIADAIGSPLSSDDTFTAMGNDINQMTINFRNALAAKGVNAPADKMERLIARIDEIVQSGNVLNNQIMVSGEHTLTTEFKAASSPYTVNIDLDFDPEYFIVYIPTITRTSNYTMMTMITTSLILTSECPSLPVIWKNNQGDFYIYNNFTLSSYDNSKFVLNATFGSHDAGCVAVGDKIKWYAIGSSQLPNNGGERTITPSTTDQVLPNGYYSGDITIKGDSDLKPENIVDGKEIFGVTGNAKSIDIPSYFKVNAVASISGLNGASGGIIAEACGTKIYCFYGGSGGNWENQNLKYAYEPSTKTWSTVEEGPGYARWASSAVVGNNIYKLGGYWSNNTDQMTNYCYDTSTNTWSTKTNMTTARYAAAATAYGGKIYVFGGYYATATTECYDPSTNTWSAKNSMPTGRCYITSSLLNDKIYVIGGYSYNDGNVNGINECYDISTDTWSTKTKMSINTYGGSASTMSGKIFYLGGVIGTSSKYTTGAGLCYDATNDTWESRSQVVTARTDGASTVLDNIMYYIAGDTSVSYQTGSTIVESYFSF